MPVRARPCEGIQRRSSIGRCLDNLVEQIDGTAEIVAVSNNSTDETADIVAAYQAKVEKIRLLDQSRQGIVPARNRGLASATSDVIARIDADTIVEPGWAAAIDTFFSSAGPSSARPWARSPSTTWSSRGATRSDADRDHVAKRDD